MAVCLSAILIISQIQPTLSKSHGVRDSDGVLIIKAHYDCTWNGNYTNQSESLTARHRQCYDCNGTRKAGNGCWNDPLDPHNVISCGFMGDQVCSCVQEWTNIDKGSSSSGGDDKNAIHVIRSCQTYLDIKSKYNLEKDEVDQIGCENHNKTTHAINNKPPTTEQVFACFCEADKCNNNEKFSNDGTSLEYNQWIREINILVIFTYMKIMEDMT